MNKSEYLEIISDGIDMTGIVILLKEHAIDLDKEISDELIQKGINLGIINMVLEGTIKYFDDKFEIVRVTDKNDKILKMY